MHKLSGRQALALAVTLTISAGCSHAPKIEEHPIQFPAASNPVGAKKLWTRRVPGLLTDVNLSRDGSTVLVATVPDRDSIEAAANRSKYFAVMYAETGKVLTEIQMPAQIKSQTISADGSLAVIASYDDQLRGFDRKGGQLWETEAFCKPYLLSSLKRVLCFHDDDAQPELGFEVFDLHGKKKEEFAIRDDALVLKIAPDEKSVVMALTHGKVIVFDSKFKPIARKKVPGEVVDVAVANTVKGKRSYVVLYNERKSAKQRIAYYGKNNFDMEISGRADQIELAPDTTNGPVIFGYANSNEGQVLMRIGQSKEDSWKRDQNISAEYTSQISVSPDTAWMGLEDNSGTGGTHSHVLGWDFDGGLKTNITVPAEEGAFLYTFSVAPQAHSIAIGSDDGRLSLFQMQ